MVGRIWWGSIFVIDLELVYEFSFNVWKDVITSIAVNARASYDEKFTKRLLKTLHNSQRLLE